LYGGTDGRRSRVIFYARDRFLFSFFFRGFEAFLSGRYGAEGTAFHGIEHACLKFVWVRTLCATGSVTDVFQSAVNPVAPIVSRAGPFHIGRRASADDGSLSGNGHRPSFDASTGSDSRTRESIHLRHPSLLDGGTIGGILDQVFFFRRMVFYPRRLRLESSYSQPFFWVFSFYKEWKAVFL